MSPFDCIFQEIIVGIQNCENWFLSDQEFVNEFTNILLEISKTDLKKIKL